MFFIDYQLVIIPIAVALITQALKLIIDGIPNNFNWQHLINDYGGMPSAHTAFISSLTTTIGLTQGFNSAAFALSLALLAVVIRDAIGFRREIGKNAAFTNAIGKEIFKKKKVSYLNEQMGHYLSEVLIGLAIGASLSVLFFMMFFALKFI